MSSSGFARPTIQIGSCSRYCSYSKAAQNSWSKRAYFPLLYLCATILLPSDDFKGQAHHSKNTHVLLFLSSCNNTLPYTWQEYFENPKKLLFHLLQYLQRLVCFLQEKELFARKPSFHFRTPSGFQNSRNNTQQNRHTVLRLSMGHSHCRYQPHPSHFSGGSSWKWD